MYSVTGPKFTCQWFSISPLTSSGGNPAAGVSFCTCSVLVFSLIDCAACSTLPAPHPAVRYIEPGEQVLERNGICLNMYYLFRLSVLFYSQYFVCVFVCASECECVWGSGGGWGRWLVGWWADWLACCACMCQTRPIDNIMWRNSVPVLLSVGSFFRICSSLSQNLVYILSRLLVMRLNNGTAIKISYVDKQSVLWFFICVS